MKIELDLPVPEGWRFVGMIATQKGQMYINNIGEQVICSSNFVEDQKYLTFERIEQVDEELEEAKKLIGKWVTVNDIHGIFQIVEVERIIASIIVTTRDGRSHLVDSCRIKTLPVWRCCESDKPKKEGRYFIRQKDTKACMTVILFHNETWTQGTYKCEWLDEGEL